MDPIIIADEGNCSSNLDEENNAVYPPEYEGHFSQLLIIYTKRNFGKDCNIGRTYTQRLQG